MRGLRAHARRLRLGTRRAHRTWQGKETRRASDPTGRRPRCERVFASSPTRGDARRLPTRSRALPAVAPHRSAGLHCLATRGHRARLAASSSAHRGDRDAPRGCVTQPDRSGASPREHADDGDLREGRSACASWSRPTLAGSAVMKPLAKLLTEYLEIRRKLGFKAKREEWLLSKFVAFLRAERSAFVTTDLALAWAN